MAEALWKSAALEKGAALCREMGLELVDVELVKDGGYQIMRFLIDRENGVDLDTCEKYHRALIPLVEELAYDFLEVSSPGLDRPLKTPRDFDRALGKAVELKLYSAHDGKKTYQGKLCGYRDGQITVLTQAGEMTFPEKAVCLIKPLIEFGDTAE